MTDYPIGPHLASCEWLCSTEDVICLCDNTRNVCRPARIRRQRDINNMFRHVYDFFKLQVMAFYRHQSHHAYIHLLTAIEIIEHQCLYDASSDEFVITDLRIATSSYASVLNHVLHDR